MAHLCCNQTPFGEFQWFDKQFSFLTPNARSNFVIIKEQTDKDFAKMNTDHFTVCVNADQSENFVHRCLSVELVV